MRPNKGLSHNSVILHILQFDVKPIWEAVCRNGDFVPFTYVRGCLLSHLKFLLGILKRLGVLVQLILCSLQFLLQSYQVILELRFVLVWTVSQG